MSGSPACWRHEGALTPATLVDAGALAARRLVARPTPSPAGITRLTLAPDDLGPATGRQLGFWGGDPAAADRAGRALARVQGMLGPDAVVTAVAGRWAHARSSGSAGCRGASRATTRPEPAPPRRGRARCPGPAPARVFDPPVPAELVDADGAPVAVSGRGEPSAPPAGLRCAALPDGGRTAGGVERAVGPRPALVGRPPPARALAGGRRRGDGTAIACLVVLERGRAAVEAVYD